MENQKAILGCIVQKALCIFSVCGPENEVIEPVLDTVLLKDGC